MAEALGIASGIAGLVSLTIEVFGISYKYINGVRNASSSARLFLGELENLKNVLAQIGKMTKETHQENLFGDDGSCLLSIKDSNEYHDMLRKVHEKLTERQSDSSFRSKFKTLTWPFSEKETLALLKSLHRCLEVCDAALTADSRTLGMLTLTEIRESKRSQRRAEMDAVLEWLSPLNMYQKQQDVFSRRQSSTGSWLLRDLVFESWEKDESSHRTLWCPGDPGTGKTVMTSLVVDYLVKSYASDDIRVAYVYCDYKDQVRQTASNLIACLIRQIIGRPDALPQQLEKLHKELVYQKRNPSLDELKTLLVALCNEHERIYLIVDALDECEASKERRTLLPLLEILPHKSTRLFVTSRPNSEDISQTFDKASQITISASESDLQQYITEKIDERKDVVSRLTPDLKNSIVSTISAGASGMFLLAALQIDRIFVARTVKGIKAALKSMPGELGELYRQTLERIKEQAGEDGALGMKILSWITYAKRPLSVDELRHGLAVEYDEDEVKSKELDEDNLLSPGSLVDVCVGLVVIDSTSRIIRLVHYTTQEYFDKTRLHFFEDAEVDISRACLTYLSYDFGTEFTTNNLVNEALQSHPFLDYATHHWFSHVKSSLLVENPDPILLKAVMRFSSSDSISTSTDVLRAGKDMDIGSLLIFEFRYRRPRESKMFPLEVASVLGLEELVSVLFEFSTGACPGLDSSLAFASYMGHLNVVKLLLGHGARVDSVVELGGVLGKTTALVEACKWGHLPVAKVMIENGADIHYKALADDTPLHSAASHNHSTVVAFLIEEGVNVNARASFGQTACHIAAMFGCTKSIKCLLNAHYELELADEEGKTALHYAADYAHLDVIELLLDRGADASAKDKKGSTARNFLEYELTRTRHDPYKQKSAQPLIQRLLQMEQASSAPAKKNP